ncbi:MAG: hypothetical protein MZV64_30345 [Ignavibacteriales bacterium]|nr:hypothetical protein [Ignavibacteriales bacterium]
MKKNKSNLLLYGLIVGGIVGAGLAIYFGSRFISQNKKRNAKESTNFMKALMIFLKQALRTMLMMIPVLIRKQRKE